MRGEHEDAGARDELLEAGAGFGHEGGVDGANAFVEEEDFGFDAGDHAEGEADAHAGGVGAKRHGEVIAELGEFGDFIHFLPHLAAGLSQEEAADDDVFVAGDFRVHAHAEIEDGGHAAADIGGAAGGFVDSGEQAQERGFAGAIVPDEANAVAFAQVQVDIAEGFDDHHIVGIAANGATSCAQEGFFHGAGFGVEDGEVDAGAVGVNGNHGAGPFWVKSRGVGGCGLDPVADAEAPLAHSHEGQEEPTDGAADDHPPVIGRQGGAD